MPQVRAYACDDARSQYHPMMIDIREPGPGEVLFDIKYAGICHSDIHTARSEWGPIPYPFVGGHEIAGVVTKIGEGVTTFKVGDRIGVGCLQGSCKECEYCTDGHEQFCDNPHAYWTFRAGPDGKPTYGGYAQAMTVREDFACHVPDAVALEHAAPLMCAGITMYSPLRRWGAGPGKKVAIVGMGGLGHMGVQLAAAMGAEVSVISHGRSKEADARQFGATAFYATAEEGTIESLASSFDLIICTVSADDLDYPGLIRALKPFGVFVDVGLPENPMVIPMRAVVNGNKVVAGSQIGGIAETQEMLEFCAQHSVRPVVEIIDGDSITEAYDKVVASKVRYRFVIDTSTF